MPTTPVSRTPLSSQGGGTMQLRCGRIRRGSDNHDVRSVVAEDVGGTGMYEVQDNTPENARQERRNRPRKKKSPGKTSSTARELVGRKGVLCGRDVKEGGAGGKR